MKYYVYIIHTVNDKLYTGIALDVKKRFEEHLSGKGAKYTRANKPDKIVYIKECETKNEALKEEYRIKNLARVKKLELIQNYEMKNCLEFTKK